MTQSTTGEQKTTNEADQAQKLSEAIRLVKAAIEAEENHLKQIAEAEEQDPVMVEGETSTGYPAHIMVDPARVAQIMLDYWYPLYTVLGEDAPQGMWNELARMVGLDNVISVDL